ncbi:MAG: M1 family aminopeptidase [Candidatus Dormibacteria bacterium]
MSIEHADHSASGRTERCGGGGGATRNGPGRRTFGFDGTEPKYPPDRFADILHIRLELRVDPRLRTLTGVATHRLRPVAQALKKLPLKLEELTVDSVTMGGKQLDFHHEGGVLDIRFKPAIAVGREVEVSIAYHGSPRTGLNFTGPDKDYPERPYQAWSQGQDEYARFWFPNHDFPNQRQTTEVIVETPGEFQTVSNGSLVSVETQGKWKRWHWLQEVPHVSYLVSLVVGQFEVWEETAEGTPLQYYVPPGRVADGHRAFDETPAMLRILSELAGTPYPYVKYASVVVQDFTWGGMENTSATTYIDDLLPDARGAADYDSGRLVSHELAHQWFGDLLTCRDWAHAWLNEGFATYAWPYYAEHAYGIDEAQRLHLTHADEYFAEDREYRRPIVARTYTEPYELFDVHTYEKGAWVLWMLRHVLGEQQFNAGVQEYVRRHSRGLVVTEDLVRAMEDTSGRSLGWFFDQWIYGGGHPEFKVAYRWDDDSRTAHLSVSQEQKVDAVTHVFRMPVQLAFGMRGGKCEVREVEVGAHGPEDGFTFTLPARPSWVRFDEGNRVLKKLEFDRPEELLLNQLKDDEMTGRVEAALQLGRKGTPRAVDALATALEEDLFWFVQAAAARALGIAQGETACAALLKALAHPHSRVRTAVAGALGAFTGHDEVIPRLLRTLARDRSYTAAGAAANSLGRLGARSAVPELEKALDRPSHRNTLAAGALRGLAELRDPALLGTILAQARPGREERLRAQALVSAARLARTTTREQRDEVRRVAEQSLRDPLYFVRRGALISLETLGDVEAIPALRATVDRDVEGAVRYEARVAIENLQRGTTREHELTGVREDLDELRRGNHDLRDKVAKLESTLKKGRSGR